MKTKKQEILDLINDETKFKQACFPNIFELEKSFQELEKDIKKTQECSEELEKWIKIGEDFIEVEPEEE
ncbi:LeoA protein [Helicobacter acinonychis]|nr:LeoA protein [Helicobacter acinonychis]